MAKFPRSAKLAITRAVGSSFWRFYTLTSSNLTTTAQALTVGATGRLLIKQCILKTDSTGLAGGTNFVLSTSNVKGVVNFMVETVANLGANKSRVLSAGNTGADITTSFGTPTVTSLVTLLESGKVVNYNNTVGAGTGAGTIDIAIQFERVDENADIL